MATQRDTPTHAPLPSSSTPLTLCGLSIAVSVVRSIPPGRSLSSHIAALVACVKNCNQPSEANILGESHVDLLQYWKHLFTDSQDEVNRLRTEIQGLKQLSPRSPNSHLQEPGGHKTSSADTAPATLRSSSEKRRSENQMKCTTAERKRRRTRLSSPSPDDNAELSQGASQASTPVSRNLDSVLHYPYAPQHSEGHPQFDSDAIALNVILVTDGMRHVIGLTPSETSEEGNFLRSERHRLVFSKDRAVFRCFPQILQALEVMSPDKGLSNTAIYAVQQVFHALLQAICGEALAGSREDAGGSEDHPDGNESIGPDKDLSPGYVRSVNLCDGFLSMLRSLDQSKPWHKEILEGALYLLITAVGRRLHWALWQQEVCAEEPLDPFRLQGESMEGKQAAFEAQVPFLIPLLEQSLSLAARRPVYPTRDADATELSTGSRKIPCGISGAAWIKLQNTLIQAAFAVDNKDALHFPPLPPELSDGVGVNFKTLAPCKHSTETERFKSELWRLLGWDILDSMNQAELRDSVKG